MSSTQSQRRRIDDVAQNRFLAEDPTKHRATAVAPESLIQSVSPQDQQVINDRQRHVESLLGKVIGRPKYAGAGFLLYCGDCTEFLSRLGDSPIEVDLTLTSPPYNIGKEYEENRDVNEYIGWCGRWMTQIHEHTAPSGAFWLNVGYLNLPDKGLCVPIPYLIWDKSPFYFLQEVVWKYGAGVSTKRRLSPRNEKWLFYVRDANQYTFNLDAIRDPNVKYPNQKKNGKFRCNPLGKNPSDVWEVPKVTTGSSRSSRERTSHPAQFPLAIAERIIRASSNMGELVLDPFAGSCSAGIATAGAGRIFIGLEIREDYCEMAIERFEAFQRHRSNVHKQKEFL